MRKWLLFSVSALMLSGCNGGEDFSGAAVPGCPIGTKCEESPQGDVLVELVGQQVANLGYECGSSLGYTSEGEVIVNELTVPPYNALCPSSATSVEFFIGSGLFEGNKISLGRYFLPQQLQKGSYQLTTADLISSPNRVPFTPSGSSDTSEAINRAALLQALDTDGNPDDAIHLSDAANDYANTSPAIVPDILFAGYANYDDFTSAWSRFVSGVKAQDGSIAGFESDTSNYLQRLKAASDRLRAGLYAFDSAGECLIFEGCQFQSENGARVTFGVRAMVLPDGTVLSGGLGLITKDNKTEADILGFNGDATLSDTLEFVDGGTISAGVTILGAGIDGAPATNAQVKGRVLGQTLFAGIEFDGRSDYKLDYPSSDYVLKEADKGLLQGQLIGNDATGDKAVALRATKTAAVQVVPDVSKFSNISGIYTVRLMRACVDESSDDDVDLVYDGTKCKKIDNPEQEIGSDTSFNYPTAYNGGNEAFEVTEERVRFDAADYSDAAGRGEFCLNIGSDGLIRAGAVEPCNDYTVGMVSRTFEDNSANILIRLAPGIENRDGVPHFNTEIQGRMDLNDTCKRLYRLSDESFANQVRAAWQEDVYLRALRTTAMTDEALAEPVNQRMLSAIQSGAVQFFKGLPGDPDCDPLVAPAPASP